jgi:hypothetical protein
MFSQQDASSPAGDKPASRGFTRLDHDALQLAQDHMHVAAELINGVMERRRLDLSMQMVSFLSEAKQDADLGERAVTMAEKYMGWTEGEEEKSA